MSNYPSGRFAHTAVAAVLSALHDIFTLAELSLMLQHIAAGNIKRLERIPKRPEPSLGAKKILYQQTFKSRTDLLARASRIENCIWKSPFSIKGGALIEKYPLV